MTTLTGIPAVLRDPPCWLIYYPISDPLHPERKPGKHPSVAYRTPEDRAASLRPLDGLLQRSLRPGGGYQRWADPAEGLTYIDIDHCRNADGSIEPWAQAIVDAIDSYTEVSGSGTGLHIVCRARLDADCINSAGKAGTSVEMWGSGKVPNRLLAMTGDTVGLQTAVNDRQAEAEALLQRVKAGEFKPGAEPAVKRDWRDAFRDPAKLATGDIRMLIKKFMPEGVTLLGSCSGVGKTWLAVSMLKALITSERFLGLYDVPELQKCLYLIPEAGDRALRYRLERMRVPLDGERYRVRTLADGILRLNDPLLIEAVQEWHPVVFLDTAIRFKSGEENSASDNAPLADALFALLRHGAQAVVGLHHSPKPTAQADELTLENVLRGTGDLGAMCDAVWGLQHDRTGKSEEYASQSKMLTRLYIECVKPRDFEPAEPFRILGRPCINETGNFSVMAEYENEGEQTQAARGDLAVRLVDADPTISQRQLAARLEMRRGDVDGLLKAHGRVRKGDRWVTE